MPKPRLEPATMYYTAPQARKVLGLSRGQFEFRVSRGILPSPSFIDTSGVRYFNDSWLKLAKAVLNKAKNYGNNS